MRGSFLVTDAVPSFYMVCKEGEDNLTGEKNKNHRQRKIAYVLCCSLLVGAAVVCLKKWVFPRLGDTGETNTRIADLVCGGLSCLCLLCSRCV